MAALARLLASRLGWGCSACIARSPGNVAVRGTGTGTGTVAAARTGGWRRYAAGGGGSPDRGGPWQKFWWWTVQTGREMPSQRFSREWLREAAIRSAVFAVRAPACIFYGWCRRSSAELAILPAILVTASLQVTASASLFVHVCVHVRLCVCVCVCVCAGDRQCIAGVHAPGSSTSSQRECPRPLHACQWVASRNRV